MATPAEPRGDIYIYIYLYLFIYFFFGGGGVCKFLGGEKLLDKCGETFLGGLRGAKHVSVTFQIVSRVLFRVLFRVFEFFKPFFVSS